MTLREGYITMLLDLNLNSF